MHLSQRRATALCALLTSTFLSATALAQTGPEFRQIDENGVDLVQGDFLTSFAEGSIGSGDAALELTRMLGNAGTNGTSGTSQWDHMLLNVVSSGTYVDFGPQVSKFPAAQAMGQTLTGSGSSYIYTAADGTKIQFTDPTGGGADITNFCNGTGQASCILLPTTITSPNGKTVTLEYSFWSLCLRQQEIDDPINCTFTPRLSGVSNSYGYSILFSYASAAGGGTTNPPASFHQRTGATFYNSQAGGGALASVSYSYPSTGVTDITDTGGRVWRVTKSGTLNAIRRPGAAADTTSAALNAGKVTSVTREGVTTTYSRAVNGNTSTMTVTNPLSQTTTVATDLTVGRPASVTNALSKTTSYQYDSNRRLKRVTQPEGNYVEYTYDARGNVTQTQMVSKTGAETITTSAAYDASCANILTCNKPNSTTDARLNTTNYAYDPTHGGITAVTLPAATSGGPRPETRYSYALLNGEYQLTGVSACQTTTSCIGTADEAKATASYDANGNVTSVSKGNGAGTLTASNTMTYDAIGNLLTVDGPLAGTSDTTRFRYNAARERVGTASPDPDGAGSLKHRAVRNTYTNGLLTKVESGTVNSQSDGDWAAFSALEAVETGYDTYGRPTTQTLKSGSTSYSLTQSSYDALGRVDCVAQRMNPAVYGSLPTSACSLGTQGTSGPDRIVKTEFDQVGRIWKVTSAFGTAEASVEVTKAYSDNGQLASVTDAEANKTSYEYDGFDRLKLTRYPVTTVAAGASSTTDYEQLGYDAASNVTSRRLRDGQTIGFTYDNLNRVTLKNLPGSEPDVSYSYDLLGRMTAASRTDGHYANFAFDALGRNTSASTVVGGTVGYQHDLAGRRTRLTWNDGFYVNYDYNVTSEMTAVRENGATSGVGVLATYGYDDLGRRTSITRGNGTVTSYGYDAVSRLASLSQNIAGSGYDFTHGFTYNPVGQIASVTRSNDAYAWAGHYNVDRPYTVNGLNQATAAGTTNLGYDGRGNLTSSGSSTYTYTSENRLTSGPGVGWIHYDPLGRLIQTIGGTTTRYSYDGQGLIAEYDNSNNLQRRYVHGPGADEPLVWYQVGDATPRRWLHADERGSIVAVTNDAGTAIAVNKYDEYGIPGNNTGRFQYTGQAWLPELGMYYYKARMYSPTLGRFMQTDPIGYGDGMNMYDYVGGDPVNMIDPSGLDDEEFTIIGKQQLVRALSSFLFGGSWGHETDYSLPGEEYEQEVVITANCATTACANTRELEWELARDTPIVNDPRCTNAIREDGEIHYSGANGTIIVGGGITGGAGTFTNQRTGTTGSYFSLGGGGGVDIGVGGTAGTAQNLALFGGGDAAINVGAGPGNGSLNFSLGNKSISYSGYSGGFSLGIFRVGASATMGGTKLYNCITQ